MKYRIEKSWLLGGWCVLGSTLMDGRWVVVSREGPLTKSEAKKLKEAKKKGAA